MKKIYEAFQSITPNDFEKIKENTRTRNEEVIIQVETKKRKQYYKIGLVGLVCSLIIAFSLFLSHDNAVFATIGVDVNPSIELEINEKEEIIQVKTHNDDGEKIVGDMELQGTSLDVAVNALIGSMLKEGYIDELKNSLLITVSGNNKSENERLRKEISENIDQLLKGSHIDGSIVSQTLDSDDNLETLAKKYNISTGKAEIIQQLIQKNNLYTFEELKDLSVNDLNILLDSNHIDNIQVNGKVSTGNYIGETKAKQIVEADAHVSQPVYEKIELDYEDGVMVYEIEFVKDSVEYEYDINATNGDILKKENKAKKTSSQSQTSQNNFISESKAKSIVMNHAGVSSVKDYKIEKDKDDGVWEYEIEFTSGQKKYEYTIRATDGTILEHETENTGVVTITSQEAKQKALNHAGVSSTQVKDLEVDLEDGHYEISFETVTYEYEYKIDASSGKIIDYEKEAHD